MFNPSTKFSLSLFIFPSQSIIFFFCWLRSPVVMAWSGSYPCSCHSPVNLCPFVSLQSIKCTSIASSIAFRSALLCSSLSSWKLQLPDVSYELITCPLVCWFIGLQLSSSKCACLLFESHHFKVVSSTSAFLWTWCSSLLLDFGPNCFLSCPPLVFQPCHQPPVGLSVNGSHFRSLAISLMSSMISTDLQNLLLLRYPKRCTFGLVRSSSNVLLVF